MTRKYVNKIEFIAYLQNNPNGTLSLEQINHIFMKLSYDLKIEESTEAEKMGDS